MIKTYFLPAKLKKELRKIWGVPFFGKKKEVKNKFENFIEKKKFKKIITVGDYCSLNLPSDVKIFDGRIKRRKINPPPKFGGRTLSCQNPAGTIQSRVWPIIKKAIKDNKNVFVKGEEDLLVIPTVLLSRNNFAVLYGLPKRGIGLIEVSAKIKKSLNKLLKKFHSKKS